MTCAVVAALLTLAATHVSAQTVVQGRVTSSNGGQPVSNAVVIAESGTGERLARTLTTEAGRYSLRTTVPPARLRVVRIGYSPKSIAVPAGDAVPLNV